MGRDDDLSGKFDFESEFNDLEARLNGSTPNLPAKVEKPKRGYLEKIGSGLYTAGKYAVGGVLWLAGKYAAAKIPGIESKKAEVAIKALPIVAVGVLYSFPLAVVAGLTVVGKGTYDRFRGNRQLQLEAAKKAYDVLDHKKK